MNLTGFKKVQEDDSKAILKNKHGHSITIAKDKLSKAHAKSLASLPLHAAEGVDTEPQKDEPAADAPQTLAPETVMPERTPQQAEIPQQPQMAAAPQAMPAEQTPAPQTEAAPLTPQQTYQKAYSDSFAQHAQRFGQEAAAFDQDGRSGHITPKTMHDLYAEKSTLGKIGTIFGLMVSGIGSGMAHQSNMALEMMQKELDRDLEGQKNSKTNAMNYFRANQENELNKAQVGQVQAQTAGQDIENQIKSTTLTKNQMLIGTVQHLDGIVNKLPPGPNRAAADQAIQQVKGVAAQKIQQNSIAGATALATTQAAYVAQTNKLHQMGLLGEGSAEQMAQQREDKMLPGVGYTDKPVSPADADKLTKIKNFQNLLGEYKQLGDKVGWRENLNALTPSERARATAIRSDLISSYNDVKGLTRFTGNEEELYKNIVPNFGKFNLTGSQRDLLNRAEESVQTKKDLEYQRMGVHPFSDAQGQTHHKQSPSQSSQPEVKMMHGQQYKKVTGGWQKVK